MAKLFVVLMFLVASFSVVPPSPWMVNSHPLKACNIDRIYNLGDSISDTGNLAIESPGSVFAKLPYGQNFSDDYAQQYSLYYRTNNTGRCSNGLLMIDYIAMAAGLPLLPPYEDIFMDQGYVVSEAGSNFAVAGSTALSRHVLATKYNVSAPVTRSSLDVQLNWMSDHFDYMFENHTVRADKLQRALIMVGILTAVRADKLQRALIMVGEIGGNDYNYAMFQGKPMQELRAMVPDVIDTIINGVRRAISLGGTRIVVPGNFPIGCLPIYKTAFETNTTGAYDGHHCLIELNEFAKYHNEELQKGIRKLIEQEKPNAMVVYGDYYNAYRFLLLFSDIYGIDTQRACCGIGGKYNFDLRRMCGAENVPVCAEAEKYMSWDGIHLTQQGYKLMSSWLVRKLFDNLHCHLH